MAKQFLDYAGLQAFWTKIKEFVAANYVAKTDVDSTLSDTSTNPVQNKVINAAIVTLANAIDNNEVTVSNTLTSGTKIATITVGTTDNDIYAPATPGATSGIALDASANQYKHTNSVTAKTEYVSGTTASADGGKIIVRDVKYDAQGHFTASQDREITLSQDHTKTSITAGTAGTSSATSGTNTLDIPYVSVNANGHVTGYGTHKHTISGFATTGQFDTLSDQVNTNTDNISTLQTKVAGLASATKFIGVQTALPPTANAGDICIVGNKEYIWDETTSNINGKAGWVELGDVTDVSERITEIEKSYVSSFGGAKGAITIDDAATAVGAVDFAISDNKLTGTVNVGTTSFGGKTGAITVNSGSTTAGDVNFAMSDNKLTGKVVLPNLINGITVADSTTIDMTLDTTTTPGTPNIIASAKTGAVASDAATLTTGGQVYTYVTGVVNGLNSISNTATPVEGTAEAEAVAVKKPFAMVTSVSQTNGTVNVGTTELGPIPLSAITALL